MAFLSYYLPFLTYLGIFYNLCEPLLNIFIFMYWRLVIPFVILIILFSTNWGLTLFDYESNLFGQKSISYHTANLCFKLHFSTRERREKEEKKCLPVRATMAYWGLAPLWIFEARPIWEINWIFLDNQCQIKISVHINTHDNVMSNLLLWRIDAFFPYYLWAIKLSHSLVGD